MTERETRTPDEPAEAPPKPDQPAEGGRATVDRALESDTDDIEDRT